MIQYLPYGGFKWLSKKETDEFDLNSMELHSIDENSSTELHSIGYILEVDLEYPDQLHDLHNDYPLAPEKLEISQNMLSKYFSDISEIYLINME